MDDFMLWGKDETELEKKQEKCIIFAQEKNLKLGV